MTRIAGILVVLGLAAPAAQTPSREQREIRMAEDAVMLGLASFGDETSRKACSEGLLTCCSERADLGLALIAAKNSPDALGSLVALMRFQLDGSLAEDYDCYILAKGKQLLRPLRNAKPSQLAARCKADWTSLRTSHPRVLAGAEQDSFCASADTIRRKLKEYEEAIIAGSQCSSDD